MPSPNKTQCLNKTILLPPSLGNFLGKIHSRWRSFSLEIYFFRSKVFRLLGAPIFSRFFSLISPYLQDILGISRILKVTRSPILAFPVFVLFLLLTLPTSPACRHVLGSYIDTWRNRKKVIK